MRRRRVLALSAGALGLTGCFGNNTEEPSVTRSSTGTQRPTETTAGPSEQGISRIGGSLHDRPYRLGDDLGLIDQSDTTWLHAFLDVREKLNEDVPPQEDPDILALRRASREKGAKLFVSLQWNFMGIFGEKATINIPPAGSSAEQELIDYGVALLQAIEQPIEIVGLGNEPIWETKDEDFRGSTPRLMAFTRTVKEHVVQAGLDGDPRLVVGAFNRLHSEYVRNKYWPTYRQFLHLARNDDDIDGIDLHVHYTTLQQAERSLAVARFEFPQGLITATEFSPVWRYKQHKTNRITSFEDGDRFADRYGIDSDTTVVEYLEAAKEDRPSRQELGDFYAAMPWYNENFVEDMNRLLAEYDIRVGTFCFLTERDIRQLDWTTGWSPFEINCLYQPGLISTGDGANPHYIEDYAEFA